MNKPQLRLFVITLALIGGTALGMSFLKSHQRLGSPGVKTTPISGSPRLTIFLPEQVADYDSKLMSTETNVLPGLPPDTSYVDRNYTPRDSALTNHPFDQIDLKVVLMGTDRTSIHKPQFCLTGQGWDLDGAKSSYETIHVQSPHPYNLDVMKLVGSRDFKDREGHIFTLRGTYVYWFVADNDLTARHETRMWKSATHLVRTGELERWAYIGCFTVCWPGQEDATYDRMQKFIAAAVPEFQLATNPTLPGQDSTQQAALR